MPRLIGVGPQSRKRTLDLYCEDCEFGWVAAKFPIDVVTLEKLTESKCIICHGDNVSVFEDCLEDPNEQFLHTPSSFLRGLERLDLKFDVRERGRYFPGASVY